MAEQEHEVMLDEGGIDPEDIQEESNLDPAEEKARSSGWVPSDEWEGDPADWVDAHHFNIRGEMMQRIQSQSRLISQRDDQINELKDGLRALGEHNKKIAKVQYEKALRELRSQRAEAYQTGDVDLADELETQLDDLKDAKKQLDQEDSQEQQTQPQGGPPQADPALVEAFQEWLGQPDNKWYGTDPILRGAANALGDQLVAEGVDPKDVFKRITVEIKKEFPHKFGGGNRNQSAVDDPGSVRKSARPGGKGRKTKHTTKDLTSEELRVAKTFIESGAFKTMDEYLEQYEQIGGFEGDRL